MEIEEKITRLNKLREEAKAGGGSERIKAQRAKGKLTARERLDLLFDSGSFEEIGPFVTHRCTDFGMEQTHFPGDSVVVGYGKVNNKLVFAFSQDFTVFGGTISEAASGKICKVMDLAVNSHVPFIGILDSGGARIQEGADSLVACGNIFTRNTLYSGIIPQISVVVGPIAGSVAYSTAITDFVFMVKRIGQMCITGPNVIKEATGESVTLEDLGSAMVNATKSGNCHFVCETEEECFQQVRKLLSFLPQSYKEAPQIINSGDDPNRTDEELLHIIPTDPAKPYDMKKIITKVVDDSAFMEVHQEFARNFVVGFARLGGQSVGILAHQPSHLAGVLDIDASDKAARFARFCDCFNIPLVTFVDIPGYMPGVDQEHKGIIRHGAKLLFAYAEATVPKISVITRKAYGGAYIAMGSKSLRGDICYAWPTAEIAVMGPSGAVNIVFHTDINKSENPKEKRQQLIQEYQDKFTNPYVAAARGHIDDVIDPRETRPKIIKALEMLKGKEVINPPKKHGNIPL